MLLTGGSGSGKTMALLFLLGNLVREYPEVVIYLCDFKRGEEFSFLKGYKHYYGGNDCYKGIMDYYDLFSSIRENEEASWQKKYLLICDEYPALVNYLQMKDKSNKTKFANDVLNAVAEILMAGRGLGVYLWITTQRADSTLFANGARDNFMVICALGRLSKEQKNMLFSGQDIPEGDAYCPGEGLLLADGKNTVCVKYPLIENMKEWESRILEALSRGQDAD